MVAKFLFREKNTGKESPQREFTMIAKGILAPVLCAFFLAAAGLARAEVIDGNRIMDQDMGENLCALTFDDGPSNFTPHLLDMLKENNIPATFFMLGANARRLPNVVRRVAAEGHEIGNHTYSHPNLLRLSRDRQKLQIAATEEVFREIGVTSLYMRPPYGNFDERTVDIANENGLKLILWSMDSYDWKRLPEDYSKLRSTRGTVYENGHLRGVFLFHDIHKTTVDDFPRIIAHLRAGGCERFVTMSEYLAGIADDEPGSLMTRRPTQTRHASLDNLPLAKNRGDKAALDNLPLARCSRPYGDHEQVAHVDDDAIQPETDDAKPAENEPLPPLG